MNPITAFITFALVFTGLLIGRFVGVPRPSPSGWPRSWWR